MSHPFRSAIADALPSPDAVHARLHIMSQRDRMNVANFFSGTLPEVDVLIATPGAEGICHEVGMLRGVPSLSLARIGEQWVLVGSALHHQGQIRPLRGPVQVAVISVELTDGQPELAATVLSQHQSWEVAAVGAAVERTDARGHVRLSLLDIPVVAPVVLAGTPRGLVFERRIPSHLQA